MEARKEPVEDEQLHAVKPGMTSPGQSAPALDDDKNKRKTLAKAQAFLGQELFNLGKHLSSFSSTYLICFATSSVVNIIILSARVEQYDWYMGLVSRPEIEVVF